MVASVRIRPPSRGSPSSRITAGGFTPVVQHTVRQGRVSPVERVTVSSAMASMRVPVRISIPRARSSRWAKSARLAGISGITRSWASTSSQRVPSSRQRG
jgi:hypothetical protein